MAMFVWTLSDLIGVITIALALLGWLGVAAAERLDAWIHRGGRDE